LNRLGCHNVLLSSWREKVLVLLRARTMKDPTLTFSPSREREERGLFRVGVAGDPAAG
jgi:hypothetical protein